MSRIHRTVGVILLIISALMIGFTFWLPHPSGSRSLQSHTIHLVADGVRGGFISLSLVFARHAAPGRITRVGGQLQYWLVLCLLPAIFYLGIDSVDQVQLVARSSQLYFDPLVRTTLVTIPLMFFLAQCLNQRKQGEAIGVLAPGVQRYVKRPHSFLMRRKAETAQSFWIQQSRARSNQPRAARPLCRTLSEKSVHRASPMWALLLVRVTHVARSCVTNPPHVRRSQAARAARAVLDGIPAVDAAVPRDAYGQSAPLRRRDSSLRVPARAAAHAITLTIVAVAALVSGNLSSQAARLQNGRALNMVSQDNLGDLRILRALPAPNLPLAGWEDLTLPALRPVQLEHTPAYEVDYAAREGETLGDIAARYQVSVASLFWANGLQSDIFAAGHKLRIPRRSGIPHVIRPEDTLESLAQQYNVSPQAIVLFQANDVRADAPLPVGRELFIPGATRPYPAEILARYGGEQGIASMRAIVAGVALEAQVNVRAGPGSEYPRLSYLDAGRPVRLIARHLEWIKVGLGGDETGWVRGDLLSLIAATIDTLPPTDDFSPPPPRWVWPTQGELTSTFGWRTKPFRSFHDGIDLANRAGTQIVAASAGEVIRAGWCGGFGYCVEIDHGDGITTLYAHMLKKPLVVSGDTVAAGDRIGLMGSTYDRRGGGYSTGVHLHFILKVNGKAVNPKTFLS